LPSPYLLDDTFSQLLSLRIRNEKTIIDTIFQHATNSACHRRSEANQSQSSSAGDIKLLKTKVTAVKEMQNPLPLPLNPDPDSKKVY
jgi:hypothetical protein